MRTVCGRPRLGPIDVLLAQPVILGGAGRFGRKGEDRLLVGGALLQADTLGYHGLEYLTAENFVDLRSDIAAERGALVVHGDDDAEDSQIGIGPRANLLDGLEQIVGAFERKIRRLD